MKKSKWLGGILALVMLFTSAGCATNANEQKNTGTADKAAPAEKKELVLAYSEGGTTMDPAEANDLTSDTIVLAAYDQLITYGVKNVNGADIAKTDEIKPMLAKEWKVSDDKKTYTFTLQDNIKFQSGNPVNAEAVVWSYNYVKNSKNGSFLYGMSKIEKVTAINDKTVEIKLSQANHMFLQIIAMYNFSIIDSAAVKDKNPAEYLKTNAAGSGPFKVEKWDPATEAVFTANDKYWQGAPKVNKVTLKFIKEASNRVMLLDKGDVDMGIEIPVKDVVELKKNDKLAVRSDPSNRILYFALNNKIKPFDNVKVRQAIAYAIPYEKLTHDVMYDQAKQLKSSVPSNTPGSTDAGFVYKYDLEKAKALLKEAGYEKGFSFDFVLGSGFQDWEDDAVLIQSEFEKIGVKMNIQKMARAQFLQAQKERNLPAYISKWTSFVNDPGYHLGFLLYGKGSSNYGNYTNAQVDKLWEQASMEPDQAKREVLYKQAQEIITTEAPWLYLYEYNRVVVMNKGVKGYIYYPDEIIRFYPLSK